MALYKPRSFTQVHPSLTLDSDLKVQRPPLGSSVVYMVKLWSLGYADLKGGRPLRSDV